jgi:hypothetical protein
MARSKTHKRVFAGEWQAQELAQWLNRDPLAFEQRAITRLITGFQEFLAVGKYEHEAGNYRSGDTGEYVREAIDRWLERYSRAIDIVIMQPATSEFTGVEFGLQWRPGNKVSSHEMNAFLNVFNLAREQSINKLRRCLQCHRWMFVKFPDGDRAQKCCSPKCRDKFRNAYMKKYMKEQREQLKKQREAERLQAAKHGRRLR